MEEAKDGKSDFEKAVVKEIRVFIEGLKNFKIVHEADITELKTQRTNLLSQIEALGKFKDAYEGGL